MSFTDAEALACRRLLELAREEDLGEAGDRTSAAIIPAGLAGQAVFVVRQEGVIAGLPAAELTFERYSSGSEPVIFTALVEDGSRVGPGTPVAHVQGSMRTILAAERVALNFLQRLSGVATLTRQHADLIAGLSCRLLDTRKTTPGWRLLEKYAVRCGGGHNHRLGLHDGVLIKDNHLAALARAGMANGGLAEAIRAARAAYGRSLPLEVEVDTLEQLDLALASRPDIILLDNMNLEQLREAVRRRNAMAPEVLLEASGGVRLANLRAIAETGVDRVSVGALTHSAVALDLALDYQP